MVIKKSDYAMGGGVFPFHRFWECFSKKNISVDPREGLGGLQKVSIGSSNFHSDGFSKLCEFFNL